MTKVYNHITEDEKIKLARITRDCLDTHVMQPPKTFLSLAILDRDGNEIERHEMLSKSWTRNFYNALFFLGTTTPMTILGSTYGEGYLTRKLTDGAINSHPAYILANDLVGGAGINYKGIVVGSSNSAESFESHIMGGIISSGNGAGQLVYSSQDATAVSYNSGTKKMSGILRRYFNNNSGSAIIVREVGLIINESSYGNKFLINRDVLPVEISVPNGGQLKVDYVIELVYPA